jgi:3-oxoacyl-[acyl-carrier protein] reductase
MAFHGSSFLVTGGSRGIGRAVALALGARGATVAVQYAANRNAAEDVVAAVADAGGEAFAVGADLSEPTAPQALISEVARALEGLGHAPRLRGIVLAAGELVVGDLESLDAAAFDRAMAVNARAPLFVVQAALPLLTEGSRIVTISAAITDFAVPTLLAQSAAKAALQNLGRNLAATLGPQGITVTDVAPGVVRTDLAQQWLADDAYVAQTRHDTALDRVGEPEDIADAVLMLLGPEARWITGETIRVTGGYHL